MDDAVREQLNRQLRCRGMEPQFIPAFLRLLKSVLALSPQVSLWQINRRLTYLGWPGFELDYHTLQLALACLEPPDRGVSPCMRCLHPVRAFSA